MQIHIKRDGTFLCLIGETDKFIIKYTKEKGHSITFNEAVKAQSLSKVCDKCCEKFYDKLNRLKNPIQV
jgi:hypothetical protein